MLNQVTLYRFSCFIDDFIQFWFQDSRFQKACKITPKLGDSAELGKFFKPNKKVVFSKSIMCHERPNVTSKFRIFLLSITQLIAEIIKSHKVENCRKPIQSDPDLHLEQNCRY